MLFCITFLISSIPSINGILTSVSSISICPIPVFLSDVRYSSACFPLHASNTPSSIPILLRSILIPLLSIFSSSTISMLYINLPRNLPHSRTFALIMIIASGAVIINLFNYIKDAIYLHCTVELFCLMRKIQHLQY